ncbi:MAG TPA: hypothetical protein IAD27_07205 [Candidatus Merdousia gallistercoris]|nr:hypothetical protein [Candidatus Merdousia gallistercoris]
MTTKMQATSNPRQFRFWESARRFPILRAGRVERYSSASDPSRSSFE